MENLKTTPLHNTHRQLGARMVDFVGWHMPVQYEGALAEHQAVRNNVGLFDVSHMGRFRIRGADALPLLQTVTCNNVAKLAQGQAQYSALLNERGTFIDDIVINRISDHDFLVCVNSSNRQKDYDWIERHRKGDVSLSDDSEEYAQIAIQGPKSQQLTTEVTGLDLSPVRFYWFTEWKVEGHQAFVARTGYTGEDGFEIYLPSNFAVPLWDKLMTLGKPLGVAPAGLAARNTLRLEMRYPLYGNDIDDTTTPWEAGLGWIVKLSKGDFIGKAVLDEQRASGVKRLLAGFELVDRGIARDHCAAYLEGRQVGTVTSGSYSPSLQKSIGLVYLPVERSQPGSLFDVDVRGRHLRARVVETPFYKRRN